MLDNKELTIRKHSAMIQTSVRNLTLTQRKAINFLIFIAQQSGYHKTYQTTVADIKRVCNLASTDNVVIRGQLKALTQTTIEFNYLDKDKENAWEISPLLAGCKVLHGKGSVEFAFSPFLLDRILHPEMYAPINIILIAGLKCSYAVVLYEFLRDYLTSPAVPVLTIEEFRELLGIDEHKYAFFPSFKKKVLLPATEEINLKTDICCRYELVKERGVRNKYSHIRFFVSKKTGDVTYEKNPDVKNESPDLSMDLFEKAAADNKAMIQLPENILAAVPDNQRTETVKELIQKFLEKGDEFVISNIKYTLKKSKDNFPAYLKQALESDYARHQREIKQKAAKKESVKKQKEAQKEAEKRKLSEIAALVDGLPRKEYVQLWKEAEAELFKLHSDNPFFKRESVIIAKMVELYLARHEAGTYSGNDID